ncbi:MAG TPA: hypothetical protein ENK75_04495, partial [Saprospiraceae bacterium]|nr:hypothetical protein [Saprospiraceae bacterium]
MKSINQTFVEKLKQQIPDNISTTDEIASVLGINYDAAYRRVNEKVPFTLDEVITLSKKFDISLNALYEINEPNSYLIRESKPIVNIEDIITYFEKLYKELSPLIGRDDASILFATREFPMFYFFHNPLLIRFKIFIWSTVLGILPMKKYIQFKDFEISDRLIKVAQKAGKAYNAVNVTEIWSFGSINNVLQQLLYLYNMRQIAQDDALLITDALRKELKKIEINTSFSKASTKRKFELY